MGINQQQTMIVCDYQLCEEWTLPDDLVGWTINEYGHIVCEEHRLSNTLVGSDPIQHFDPPSPNERIHS